MVASTFKIDRQQYSIPFETTLWHHKLLQVIMRRMDGSVNFRLEWDDFKRGFGSLDGEFFAGSQTVFTTVKTNLCCGYDFTQQSVPLLGNELLHQLTANGNLTYSVRVDIEDYNGAKAFAIYTYFSIGAESDNYTLHVSGYLSNSTAGQIMTYHI